METSRQYTLKQISEHNTEQSCWIVYRERVYDVTKFLRDHPGGEDLVLEYGGKDVTCVMKDVDSHEHSEAAYDILMDYCIGSVHSLRQFHDSERAKLHRQRIAVLEEEVEYNTYGEEDFVPTETNASKDTQFLDLRKALIPQFFNKRFTKTFYLEQVHKPRYLPTSAVFFGHPLLEPLTKTVWYAVPLLWLPFVIYQIYQAYTDLFSTLVLFVLGVFIWSLLEYGLHRCLFHFDDHLPDRQWAFLLHFVLHGFHHFLPMDRLRLVVPPALFIILAYPWIQLAHWLFPTFIAHGIVAGGIFGYILYDMTHYYLHHSKVISFHFKEMKKYHLAHHYKDFEAGYGITSKFWDNIFGTRLEYQ
ncbi:uncharacterized protein BX664DRAFT_341471 [Halteromyces radiatus]|uniref:uncharacterized protein n=1 Tax=Halteromyces radiatus TaxID=101107 RepID=UPI00221FD27E|nr:uncharacterized protein BX664DRAFT_341471 [Halteromyces radiatus]KAI8079795.1 hypothetical protein BX664DRAFT_341471 [Halteromyces radiatus]